MRAVRDTVPEHACREEYSPNDCRRQPPFRNRVVVVGLKLSDEGGLDGEDIDSTSNFSDHQSEEGQSPNAKIESVNACEIVLSESEGS